MTRGLICLLSFSLNTLVFASQFFQIESPSVYPVRATIPSGILITHSKQVKEIKREIQSQLNFAIGQLNAMEAAPALSLSLKIRIRSVTQTSSNQYTVRYWASFLVGWDRSVVFSNRLKMYFPKRADENSLANFYNAYIEECGLLFEEGVETFFFYFRPHQESCPISKHTPPAMVQPLFVYFQFEPSTESIFSPHYKQIWSDKTLTVTLFFSEAEAGFPTGGEHFYELLLQELGVPDKEEQVLTASGVYKRALYDTGEGVLDIGIFDLEKNDIFSMDPSLTQRLKTHITGSDLVVYNGHAGYGKKLRFFTHFSSFLRGSYKIVYLNGCDTFSYIDGRLLQGPIDVVATGLSGYFSFMPAYSLEMIKLMLEKKARYWDILSEVSVGTPIVVRRW